MVVLSAALADTFDEVTGAVSQTSVEGFHILVLAFVSVPPFALNVTVLDLFFTDLGAPGLVPASVHEADFAAERLAVGHDETCRQYEQEGSQHSESRTMITYIMGL